MTAGAPVGEIAAGSDAHEELQYGIAAGSSAPVAGDPRTKYQKLKDADDARKQLTGALSEGAKELDPKELEKMKPEERRRYEDLKKLQDLPKEDKDLILERTKGLSGDALVKEMAAIDSALKTDNADRALGAYADIQKVIDDAKAEPDAKKGEAEKRLDSDVVVMMLNGVATERKKNEDDRGVLGRNNARDAAKALVSMDPAHADEMHVLLSKAGGPNEVNPQPCPNPEDFEEDQKSKATQQALLLKAIAARRDVLKDDDAKAPAQTEGPSANAVHELEKFAEDIRGKTSSDLVTMTSLRNFDATGGKYNEGLKQVYADTCGATEAMGKHADADPIYAMSLQQDGKLKALDGKSAEEQKRIHEKATGHAPTSREALELNNRMADKINHSGGLSQEEKHALFLMLHGDKATLLDMARTPGALETLRAENDGHPTAEEIGQMQGKEGHGVGREMHGSMLGDELNAEAGSSAHLKYNNAEGDQVEQTDVGKLKAQDDLDRALKDGQSVPIRVGHKETGHYMTVLDVRGEGDRRAYCIHDPMTGETHWVDGDSYRSGQFAQSAFHIEDKVQVERTYIGESA